MIEIYLDGVQLEVPQDISLGLNLGIADYADPITASGAYTQTVEIPRTPHNDMAFKFSGEVLSAENFNHSEHTARIVEDGCELVAGRAFLEGVSQTSYNMQVVGEEVGWVENIRDKKLSEIDGEEIGTFRPTEWDEYISSSAEMYPKLSFVMMQHGHWYQDTDDKPIRRTWATYNDLIPIVKLHTLLEHCFAGHSIVVSDVMRKALHQTYVSMGWKAYEKARVLEEDMGFEITSRLLGANEDGELTATITPDNRIATLSVFDTIEEDENSVLSTATDSDGISVEFAPTSECAMALEIKTRFRTSTVFNTTTFQDKDAGWDDVAMGNPLFANQLYTGAAKASPFVQFRIEDSLEWGAKTLLEDKNTDVKEINTWHGSSTFAEDLSPSKMPLLGIEIARPEEVESIGYLVDYVYTRLTGTQESVIHRFYRPTLIGASHFNVVRSNQSRYGEGVIADKNYELNIYPAYRGNDGVIYGYFENSLRNQQNYIKKSDNIKVYNLYTDNHLTFDVALKTPVAQYSQGGYYPINRIYFGSSTSPGKEITVYGTEGGSLKPSFEWGVPIREGVKLSDVGGDALAEDMLRSIMQLYNLIIYTNPKTKQVHLYSFADFWNNNIVDWSDRIDLDSDISVSAMGDTIGKSVTLQYADGSPRIDYYNDRHSLPYFAYKKALSNKLTKEEKEIANSLFTPAYMAKVAEEFGSGEGKVPAVAKKGEEGNVLDFNLADVPHTLVLIPEGEESADSAQLPINTGVFGDVGNIQPPMSAVIDGVATLSFADKDGIEGLHKHYDKQIALWEKAKRLTCYCRVEAWEIEVLRHNAENINFRSLFHLNINGEDIYGRLESIEYEPSNTTNKCIFIIE